jgi:hypothetical protein
MTTLPADPLVGEVLDTDSAPVDTSRVSRARGLIADACTQRGIDEGLLHSLLDSAGIDHVDVAIEFVFAGATARPSLREMARLVSGVNRVLELDNPITIDLRSRVARTAARLRDVAAGTLFCLCAWLVVGGIFTGQNATANATSPLITAALLAASLGALALLEAAHIGAVALSTADVSELHASHPRVVKLHPRISTKRRLEDYLAGRQAGVVLVVFAVAAVTRTSGMKWLPWTHVPLPRSLEVGLEIGVPGALVVLVIGQVAPQILTARRPAAMMNVAPMAAAFTLTCGIAKLGLANPAHWLVGRESGHERIPTAPRERFEATTRDVTGHGIEVVRRGIRVGMDDTVSETVTSTVFRRPGLPLHVVEVASTPDLAVVDGCSRGAAARRGGVGGRCGSERRYAGSRRPRVSVR